MVVRKQTGDGRMRFLSVILGLALPAGVGAQQLTLAEPQAPATHSSLHRFACAGENDAEAAGGEVEFENHRSESGGYVGELRRLSLGGHEVPEKTMKLIRDTIASRTMDVVQPTCLRGTVSVMIRVYSPAPDTHDGISWVVVTRSASGQITISDSHG